MRERWGSAEGPRGGFPGGASQRSADGDTAWILIDGADHRALGGAVAWALSRNAAQLHLLVEAPDDVAGVLSRRAGQFAMTVTVWQVVGRDPRMASPSPIVPPLPLPPDVVPFEDIIRAAGAEPVVEFGVLTADVLGLEVARVVLDRSSPAGSRARLEVGVGRHDREAQRLLFPDRSPQRALADAVGVVRRLRVAAGPPHPANTLATERWLRTVLVSRPDLVGATHLAPVSPPVPRSDLRQLAPAPAAGVDRQGLPLVVVCSTGIDLNVVPSAADTRLADARPGCRLIIALPPGDDHPRTRQLAAALMEPADVVTVPPEWKGLAGSL